MGLDIFLHRVSKPRIKTGSTVRREELPDNYWIFDSNEKLCETLCRKAVRINVVNTVFNAKLIGEKFEIQNVTSIRISSMMANEGKMKYGIDCYDEDGEYITTVSVSEEDYPDVCIEKTSECLVVSVKEVDYQRKGLNDRGWMLLPGNCEYIDDKKIVESLVKDGGLKPSFLKNWANNRTVFHAWW